GPYDSRPWMADRPWKGEDGMNVKSVGLCALVLTLFGVSAVRGDDPPPPEKIGMPSPTPPSSEPSAPPPAAEPSVPAPPPGVAPRLSDWILGPRCDCCGPLGAKSLGYELYLRNGVSLPFGSGPLAKDLDPGWVIHGGSRLLFFDPGQDAAWTIDLGVRN